MKKTNISYVQTADPQNCDSSPGFVQGNLAVYSEKCSTLIDCQGA